MTQETRTCGNPTVQGNGVSGVRSKGNKAKQTKAFESPKIPSVCKWQKYDIQCFGRNSKSDSVIFHPNSLKPLSCGQLDFGQKWWKRKSESERNNTIATSTWMDGWMDGFTSGYWCCHPSTSTCQTGRSWNKSTPPPSKTLLHYWGICVRGSGRLFCLNWEWSVKDKFCALHLLMLFSRQK